MNERSIFIAALEKDDPAERAAFLEEACAGDATLRQRVEALLGSHAGAGDFLGKPAPQRLAEELAAGAATEATQGEPSADGGAADELRFLTPADKPGVLGRLGHYDVLEVVGRGGMGVVLRAFDAKLHRVVAVKVMAAQLATSATARRRFAREAQAQAAVSHDHVVVIHAVEEADGLPYLVMQYVAGESLQQRLGRGGPLELHEALRIGMQTAAGLAAAHAQGLIHRDVKPANILLENGVQRVKITDFGLARAADDASLTQSGVVAGTPHYMSPEQARGEAVDRRSDLFSLGSVLYAICTGRPPFRASGSMAVLKRVCDEAPTPVREANPEVPDWLAAIIDKLHAKDPAQRYQSAAEVAELLGQHLARVQHPSAARAPSDFAPASGGRQPPDLAPSSGGSRPPLAGKRRWLAAAAVALCLLGGLSLADATGVTHVAATVIRIFTPEGTLVVETDDPAVKVTIEGDGDLVISGAGPQEVRLKSGSYKLRAAKDGKAVKLDQDLVTITRGDTKIVHVRLEGGAPAAENAADLLKDAVLVMNFEKDTFYQKDGKTYVRDLSGQGNDGLCDKVEHTPGGKAGSGLLCKGGGLRLPRKLLNRVPDFTVACWIKNEQKPEKDFHVFLDGFDPPNAVLLSINVAPQRIYVAAWNRGVKDNWTSFHASLSNLESSWEFVAMRLRGGGSDQGEVLVTRNGETVRGKMQMQDSDPEGPASVAFNSFGLMDELIVLPRSLSDDEVDQLYQRGKSGLPLEAAPAARTKAENGAFILLAAGKERKFDTLDEAVLAAEHGDVIEIRGDGPFETDGVESHGRAMVIRAGPGYRPVLSLSAKGREMDRPIVVADSGALTLEGLTFQRIGSSPLARSLIYAPASPLRVANCRFVVKDSNAHALWGQLSPMIDVRNCVFVGSDAAVIWHSPKEATLFVDNCQFATNCGVGFAHEIQVEKVALRLTRNTFSTNVAVALEIVAVPDFFTSGSGPHSRRFHVEAEDNVFAATAYTFETTQEAPGWRDKPVPANQFKTLVTDLVEWREQRNLYPPSAAFMTMIRLLPTGWGPIEPLMGADQLDQWRQFAGPEAGAFRGKAVFAGGNIWPQVAATPERLLPKHFRLLPQSPGYRAGKDGKDLGADVDLVGPGEAYERWKKTPEYQKWLNDTGQKK